MWHQDLVKGDLWFSTQINLWNTVNCKWSQAVNFVTKRAKITPTLERILLREIRGLKISYIQQQAYCLAQDAIEMFHEARKRRTDTQSKYCNLHAHVPSVKNMVVNVASQWAGLYFCSCVCKLYRPPALMFELSLDEKQNINLLWPYCPMLILWVLWPHTRFFSLS